MAESVVLDPAAVAVGRTELDITTWVAQQGIDWGDAEIAAYVAEMARGEVPIDYRVPNRVVTIPLRVQADAAAGLSFEQVRTRLQAKSALFQREGGWLKRVRGSGAALYADVVNATLTLPDSWFGRHRSVELEAQLVLECLPDFYEDEVVLTAFSGTGEASRVEGQVDGDYPGRVRIKVDNGGSIDWRGLLACFRSRHYSSAATAALSYEAEALTPLDTATVATVTGASGGGSNNAIQHSNLGTDWTPVLSTQLAGGGAHLTHEGAHSLWARVRSTSATPPQVRCVWDVGDLALPEENAPFTIPLANDWYLVYLGEVRLDPPSVGAHRWQGVVQAKGTAGGENVAVDKLYLFAIDEAYSVLCAPIAYSDGFTSYPARDEFNQTAGGLNGKTAARGGNWATSGVATDFQCSGTPDFNVTRSGALSDGGTRRALLAAGLSGDVGVQADVTFAAAVSPTNSVTIARLLARASAASDTSDVVLDLIASQTAPTFTTLLIVRNQGVTVWTAASAADNPSLVSALNPIFDNSGAGSATITFIVFGSAQRFAVLAGPVGSVPRLIGSGPLGSVPAGSGVGIAHQHAASAGSQQVTFNNFKAWTPPADAVAFLGRSAQLTTDGHLREDAAGAAYGPVSDGFGLPRIPVSGLEGRDVECFLRGSRGDLGHLPDSGLDPITGQVMYRPCWLFTPDA